MVFNATFNNMSVISWRSVLLVEETGIPRGCWFRQWAIKCLIFLLLKVPNIFEGCREMSTMGSGIHLFLLSDSVWQTIYTVQKTGLKEMHSQWRVLGIVPDVIHELYSIVRVSNIKLFSKRYLKKRKFIIKFWNGSRHAYVQSSNWKAISAIFLQDKYIINEMS